MLYRSEREKPIGINEISRRRRGSPLEAESQTAASRSTSVASRSAILLSTNARNASMPSGRLSRSSRGESVTQRILRGNRWFENPLYGLDTRPIEPIEQRGELDRRQLHHPVHDRRPAERSLLQLLVTQFGM